MVDVLSITSFSYCSILLSKPKLQSYNNYDIFNRNEEIAILTLSERNLLSLRSCAVL